MRQRILVVDDERIIADTLGIIFRKRGFECKVSYTGADALTRIDDFRPELLLCDMSMPGMSGLEVVTNITSKFPTCSVLLLTGHYTNLRSARKWARGYAGQSKIMTKPVLPTVLLEEADALLHHEVEYG